MNRRETLEQATICVCGQREQDYGSPEDNFSTIADLWSAYVSRAGKWTTDRIEFDAHDVAIMMTLLKIGRIASGNVKEDNYIDACGYLACGAEILTGRANDEKLPK